MRRELHMRPGTRRNMQEAEAAVAYRPVPIDAERDLDDRLVTDAGPQARRQDHSSPTGGGALAEPPGSGASPCGWRRPDASAGRVASAARRARRHLDLCARADARHRPVDREPEPRRSRAPGLHRSPARRRGRPPDRRPPDGSRKAHRRGRIERVEQRGRFAARAPSAARTGRASPTRSILSPASSTAAATGKPGRSHRRLAPGSERLRDVHCGRPNRHPSWRRLAARLLFRLRLAGRLVGHLATLRVRRAASLSARHTRFFARELVGRSRRVRSLSLPCGQSRSRACGPSPRSREVSWASLRRCSTGCGGRSGVS